MSIVDLESIERKELIPGFTARMIHSENVTVALWEIKAGSILPSHSHMHEQISQVTSGEFELTIEGKTARLTEGKLAVIPSEAQHTGVAITDCTIVDTFSPRREDYM